MEYNTFILENNMSIVISTSLNMFIILPMDNCLV